MKTLANIKKDLEFNRDLSSLIEVLKNIAVSQYRALEHKLRLYENFMVSVDGFFASLNMAKVDHPFLKPRNNSQIVVAVTSDSGMLGGLNMQVVNAALLELEKIPGRLVVIGERGKAYAREGGVPFVTFGGIRDEDRYEQAMQLRSYLMGKVVEESVGYLKVIYPRPVSFTVQHVESVSFLPYPAPSGGAAAPKSEAGMIMESSLSDMIQYLVYLWAGQKLYDIFGLSRLSEFAARYVHLEDSVQKMKEIDNKLRLEYFRVRHELIDRNMRELFSARLMYGGQ
ncbi:MAG: FoF1 ATP synthase subunit gamma [Candidatus Omnitrophota bacterium]